MSVDNDTQDKNESVGVINGYWYTHDKNKAVGVINEYWYT
jgi:hypothetical protein